MPPYITTQFEFPRMNSEGLVHRVYDAFASSGAPFKSVFPWGCPADMSLDDIVDWNQTKISGGFKLGLIEHVSNDYRQVLVTLPPFDHARLIIRLRGSGVEFHLIVYESDVESFGSDALIELSLAMRSSARPRSIQTYGENGGGVLHEALLQGG